MTTVVKTTNESTSSSIDQTFTISDLSSVNSVSVNTGTVTYDTPVGTSVTVHCSNGTSTRSSSGSTQVYVSDYQQGCSIFTEWAWDMSMWNEVRTYNNASSTTTYNGGTLSLNNVTGGTPPYPSSNGKTFDQRTTTSTGGTGHYSGYYTTTNTVYYYQYNVTINYNPIKATYGTIELVSTNEGTINVRIKNLEYNSGYSQLVISMGGTTIGVSIAGTDGVAYYTSAATFSGLTPSTSYTFTAKFTHTGETAGTSTGTYSTTAHVDVPPTLNFSKIDGLNNVTATFSGYDEDGLRASNTYALYISGADDVTYGSPVYVSDSRNNVNLTYTFSKDRLGGTLIAGKTYSVRIILYDKLNQSTEDVKQIKVTKSRPLNFSWITSKASGGDFNLSALEWNNLTNAINDFRSYKGVNVASFTTALKGSDFYAYVFNEASNAITIMNSYVPNTMFKDDDIYANDVNRLRDALNEIT